MAVSQYEKDGQVLWQVYIDLRGRKGSRRRVQKRVMGIATEREARTLEKRLVRELSEKLSEIESKGCTWQEVIDRWLRHQELYPTHSYTRGTLEDYAGALRNWTQSWLNRAASDLSRADGREVLNAIEQSGRSIATMNRFKSAINTVYLWGIEERFICGPQHSPVHGLSVRRDREEKRPEILTIEEIRTLLVKSGQQGHDWYPIWVAAVLTGCRSGELHQLRRSDVEIIDRDLGIKEDAKPIDRRRYGFIRVRRSWNVRSKEVGPTKAGYWRNVPVSSEFYWFLVNELKVMEMKPDAFLLPRFWEWDKGLQARILRGFCEANGLPSIKFHTLRACFATQLITSGIPATVVMKVAGWRDMKTMQRYIRLAGIEEAGATEVLRFIPTQDAVMEHVVNLINYRKNSDN
ncbi:MAG: tyrosine-type recombinase/integrase [Bdellovibrionales bacterium]|nr:tyrosine-type recombinase/integrase [Bdellovibrionales bacterium]